MLYVLWASSPFVVKAVALVPASITKSKTAFDRWRPGLDTDLDFVTLTWYGLPRQSARVPIRDLRLVKPWFGIHNVRSVPRPEDKAQTSHLFYLGKDQKGYVGKISLLEELSRLRLTTVVS